MIFPSAIDVCVCAPTDWFDVLPEVTTNDHSLRSVVDAAARPRRTALEQARREEYRPEPERRLHDSFRLTQFVRGAASSV